MHGLINRALEDFVRGIYGADTWRDIAEALELGDESFEPMFLYDDALTQELVDRAACRLGKERQAFLEDFGTHLVTNPHSERVRRLLRFGGVDFADFLHSLEDLRGRANLAVPDLDMPKLRLDELGGGAYTVTCESPHEGFGAVVLGVLRAIADDYGALVYVEHMGRATGADQLSVFLLDSEFTDGNDFSLVQAAT